MNGTIEPVGFDANLAYILGLGAILAAAAALLFSRSRIVKDVGVILILLAMVSGTIITLLARKYVSGLLLGIPTLIVLGIYCHLALFGKRERNSGPPK
jgi:hypothetical protein